MDFFFVLVPHRVLHSDASIIQSRDISILICWVLPDMVTK